MVWANTTEPQGLGAFPSHGRQGPGDERDTMSRRLIVLMVLALAGATLAACVPVTVNITFPQEKLDSAASQIVDMSRRPPGSPPPAAPKGPGSRLTPWLDPFGPREASAETGPLEVAQAPRTDSPEIERLTAAQGARLGAVQQWMAKGCIGESSQGLLEARPGQGCGGEIGRLIADENRDREAIVAAFMKQNNLASGEAARVRASFAKAYRDRVQPGQWVQRDNGQWVKR
jgi:uncharacterized protein YdbL (DUF1318 family)